MAIKKLSPTWNKVLSQEFAKEYYSLMSSRVNLAYKTSSVFPPANQVFRAMQLCEFEKIKVVVIGQDPYHGVGQANGLCFSVNDGTALPPSLQNVFKELQNEIPDFVPSLSGDLTGWAKQGVFLLNAILSVESGKPGSHRGFGWETFTDSIISLISERKSNVVFMLWGNYARNKKHLINPVKHLILEAPHPSPLARGGFFGCNHFIKANEYLSKHGLMTIDWGKTNDY